MRKSLTPLLASDLDLQPRKRAKRLYSCALLCSIGFLLYNWRASPSRYIVTIHGVRPQQQDLETLSKSQQFSNLIAHLNPQSLQPAITVQTNPRNLPIKYNFTKDNLDDLPNEDDPWPDHHLAAKFLSSTRFASTDGGGFEPAQPEFPNLDAAKSFPLLKDRQVPFSMLPNIDKARRVRHTNRRKLPKVQASVFPRESADAKHRREKRREWVRRAFRHSWESYKEHAWGADEVKPLTGTSQSGYSGWGATIIDTLDTLLIMGFQHEYNLAREHVRQVDFTLVRREEAGSVQGNVRIPTFESNIRYIGGLLGAYALSKDALMLERAQELADWLMGSFATQSGMPISFYRLPTTPPGPNQFVSMSWPVCVAEAGSMSLEFMYLSQATGVTDYFDVVQRITDVLESVPKSAARVGSLLPAHISANSKQLASSKYTFGGQVDSYYEYLIKVHQLLGLSATESQYGRMYSDALDSAYRSQLVRYVNPTPEAELLIWGAYKGNVYTSEMEHLTCFAGGMTALSGKLLNRQVDSFVAAETARTCFNQYTSTKSGIAAESTVYYQDEDPDKYRQIDLQDGEPYLAVNGEPAGVKGGNSQYIGRPEAIEAIFYMWRTTGDSSWQDKGWIMFTNWVRSALSEYGMASLRSVNSLEGDKLDSMESFVFAETFKYYYLLFSDPGYISLDEYVFNTEAHPFKLATAAGKSKSLVDSMRSVFTGSVNDFWDGPDLKVESFYADPNHAGQTGQGTISQQIARTRW